MSSGRVGLDALHLVAQALRDLDLVRARQRPDAEIDALLIVVFGDHRRFFGAQLDARHVAQAHDAAVAIGDDQVLELLDGAQVGVREQIDLDEIALRLPDGREVVVPTQRLLHVAGRKIAGGEPIGIDPDAHRERPAAFEAHPLHAFAASTSCGCSVRDSQSVSGGHVALRRRETEIERRVRSIRPLHFDDRRLGLGGQLRAHLLQSSSDFGERSGAVVIELQSHGDRADAGAARGLDVVDAADRGDGTLDRRGQESAHALGARPGVDRRDDDRRAFDARELLHRQRQQRTRTDQDDDEIDHHRQHGVLDERVGERAHDSVPLSWPSVTAQIAASAFAASLAATTSGV